jgi:hypothetical protein
MKIVVVIFLAALTGYITLCITVHEIRINYWQNTDTKLGTISHVGVAMFLWCILITMLGIIPKEHGFKAYLVVMFAVVVAWIGYFIDRTSQR